MNPVRANAGFIHQRGAEYVRFAKSKYLPMASARVAEAGDI